MGQGKVRKCGGIVVLGGRGNGVCMEVLASIRKEEETI